MGKDIQHSEFIALYSCQSGNETWIRVYGGVQMNARVVRCYKISRHSFICKGVDIENDVSIGRRVTFINDTYPPATVAGCGPQVEVDWKAE